MKVNGKFHELPKSISSNPELKSMFFDLIDETAYNYIGKKVAKQNGDIRVAFDLMKSSIVHLHKSIRDSSELPPKDKLRVTYKTVLDVYEDKHGSKIAKTIKNLTR